MAVYGLTVVTSVHTVAEIGFVIDSVCCNVKIALLPQVLVAGFVHDRTTLVPLVR